MSAAEALRRPWSAVAAPVLVGVVAFVLARGVLLPGQGFWDTGEFQAVPPVFGTAHPTGYPSYVLLGWLASLVLVPAGEAALRMNLLSAVLLATAAGLVVVVVRQLTGRSIVGLGAGLLLALTPIPWRMGGFADPHTLHLALVAVLLVLLVGWERRRRGGSPRADRWLVASAALYGVMLGNHTLAILLAPGIAFFVVAVEPRILLRPGFVALCAGALFGTTAALYLQLPIRAAMGAPLVYGRPDTWDGFWYVVFAEQFRGDLVDPFGDLGRKVGDLMKLAGDQLGILAAAVPAAFLLTAVRRPRFALLTATWLGVTCWFAASYTNAAIDRYYLGPAFFAWTWLAALGVALVEALARSRPAGTADDDPAPGDAGDEPLADEPGDEPPYVPAWRAPLTVGAAALAIALLVPTATALDDRWRSLDRSQETWVETWLDEALTAMEPDAVVISWWSYSTPLWYAQVIEGRRPDVFVVDDRTRLDLGLGEPGDVIEANLGRRPIYVMRLKESEIDDLRADYAIEPVGLPGNLFRVTGRLETTE